MKIDRWTDPASCPEERPPRAAMSQRTRDLHDPIDAAAPFLRPDGPTVQEDMFCSAEVEAWQENKGAFLFAGEASWAELPPLYGRYGTAATRQLISEVRRLEAADAALVCDCGMQATAVVLDALLSPGDHAICMRQVYNKTHKYLEWSLLRMGGDLTVIDDGDLESLAAAIRPETRVVYAETFTNPLVRAQDLVELPRVIAEGRKRARRLRLVVDSTIATPWGPRQPLLASGIDVVVASGTKALGGRDSDMYGVIATREIDLANAAMDVLAMRGGILDWRRAEAALDNLEDASDAHARRCATAEAVAAFLAEHPRVERVYHPSLPDHPDRAFIERDYQRLGSLLSFRVRGAGEAEARRVCDALATCEIVRFALSFDGLVTKVNHHRTVSEYFTPDDVLSRAGIDRLIRIGVGLEHPRDLIACLNWGLHHGLNLSDADLEAWRDQRRRDLGLAHG